MNISGNTKEISNEKYLYEIRTEEVSLDSKTCNCSNSGKSLLDWPSGPGATEVVSSESTGYSGRFVKWKKGHSMAVDASGTVHVAWEDDTVFGGSGIDIDIFYKCKPSGGSWTMTEVVSTGSNIESHYPSLAVEETATGVVVHIAWEEGSQCSSSIFYKCKPSGGSWPLVAEVVDTEALVRSLHPSLAVHSGANAKVHVVWEDWSFPISDIVYKSKPSGGSWPSGPGATEVVSTESDKHTMCASLAVDYTGSLHVAWVDWSDYDDLSGSGPCGTDQDIFYKFRIIGSSSWPTGPGSTEVVSTESDQCAWFPSLAIESASTVHVAWKDDTSNLDIVYKSKSWGGSWPFEPFTPGATETVAINGDDPSLGVDYTTGIVHVAWHNDGIICYTSKGSGGGWPTGLGAVKRVNTESTGLSRFPFLVVEPSGTAHVAWEDYTDYYDPNNGGYCGPDKDIFYKCCACCFEIEIPKGLHIFYIPVVIKDICARDITDVYWTITLTGGYIPWGKETSGLIPSLSPSGQDTVNSDLILGFGPVTITVVAECTKETVNGFVIFFFIIIP